MKINRRRSNIEIIGDMLKVGEKGAGKTEIMYSTNMSFSQTQKYLDFLISHNFITKTEIQYQPVTYKITEAGLKLLKSIDNVKEILGWND